jgi:hypothetical protein
VADALLDRRTVSAITTVTVLATAAIPLVIALKVQRFPLGLEVNYAVDMLEKKREPVTLTYQSCCKRNDV